MNIYQVQVWSIARQRWETCYTTGSRDRAAEVWARLRNDGLSPRVFKV